METKLCLCGCGQTPNKGKVFISGHNARMKEFTNGQFQKGHIPWSDGLTKETDLRLMSSSNKNGGPHPKRGKLGHPHYPMSEAKRQGLSVKYTGSGNPFYGKKHTFETIEIIKQVGRQRKGQPHLALRGKKHTSEHNNKISVGLFSFYQNNPQAHQRLSETHRGKTVTEKTRKLLSQALMGHPVSDRVLQILRTVNLGRKDSEETRALKSTNLKTRYANSDTLRQQQRSKALANLANPEIVKKIFARRAITKPEQMMLDLITALGLPYKFTGNGMFRIGRKFPDFVWETGKQLVEVFGDFYHKGHNPQDKIDYYKQYGYDCIVFWASELTAKNIGKASDRLLDFHERGIY